MKLTIFILGLVAVMASFFSLGMATQRRYHKCPDADTRALGQVCYHILNHELAMDAMRTNLHQRLIEASIRAHPSLVMDTNDLLYIAGYGDSFKATWGHWKVFMAEAAKEMPGQAGGK